MKDKYEFYIEELFDNAQEYDLFICTVCFALSDLTILSNQLKYAAETSVEANNLSARSLMAFAREAFELLKRKFITPDFAQKYLDQIDGAVKQFNGIEKIIEGEDGENIFSDKKFFFNRNHILHYPKEA